MASAGPPSGVSSVRPLRSPWPWLGLGLGVACTFIAWGMILNTEEVRFQGLKRIQADAAVERLSARMSDIAEVLRGAAGFLGHGPLPVRAEWRTYVENLRLSESYPGSHGLSFVEWIPGGDLATHVRRVRQEGFPDYVVVPGGPLRPLPEGFSSIVYLEPMDARNQRAFGKDMLAEPRRREAMLQARDSGGITLTGKVTLYQETAHDLQAGVVLFAPVYRLGQPVETVTQRRKAFLGWASVPFRMGDLVRKTLSQELRAWDIALYDGDLRDPGNLLFDSNPEHSEAERQGAIVQSLEVAGRTWTTRVHPNPAFYADAGRRRHWEVLVGGLTATLFLFSLLITLQGAESRARRLAWQRGEDLLATESRFRALFEKAPLGMAIVDGLTGRFLSVNARLGEILGYSQTELLDRHVQSLTHPDHLQTDQASVRELTSGARVEIQEEKRYLHRDGHEVWARLSMVGLPATPGEAPRLLSILEDITEQTERQIALSESEARFRRVVESAADPIYLHDAEGRILLANSAACLSTGYSSEELLGMRVMDIDLEFREHRDAVVWKGLKPGQQAILMGRHRRKNGTLLPVEIHVGLLREEEPRQILAMVRDLSERERAQESALRASKAESLILMAAGIAHDFNNLFQALQGNLEMAEIKARMDPAIAQPLERAKAVLHKAVSLSWKMLDFSGHFFLDMKPLDLVGWLQEACPRLQADLPEGLRLDFTWGPAPLVNADQAKLEQVLKALADNAKEAVAGRDGHLRLRLFVDFGEEGTRPGFQGIWPLERPASLATVCLEVADDGPGVAPDIMNLICDPFYTTHEAGRGLGLAAAVGILSAHGAGFQIFNGEEKGLVLRMHFPPFAT